MANGSIAGAATRGALVGVLCGFAHSCIEIALLRWVGVGLNLGDLLLQGVLLGLIGGGGMGLAAIALLLSRGVFGVPGEVSNSILLKFGIACYGAVLWKLVSGGRGVSEALLWAGPALAIALAAVLFAPKRPTWLSAAGLVAAAGGAFCSALFLHLELQNVRSPVQQDLLATTLVFAVPLVAGGILLARGQNRPRFRFVAAALLAGVLWMGFKPPRRYQWPAFRQAPALAQAPGENNLILIVLDTLRADHLDLFGYHRETMPLLAKRARADFNHVSTSLSTSSWTLASHGSMFTGRYPWSHGARHARIEEDWPAFAYPLNPEVETLASSMSDAGFETTAVIANSGPLGGFDMDRGFEHYDVTASAGGLAHNLLWIYRIGTLGYSIRQEIPEPLARRTRAFNRYEPSYRRASEIRDTAIELLNAPRDRPFFLFVNFMEAHYPHLPVPEDDGRFGSQEGGAKLEDLTLAELERQLTSGSPDSAKMLEYYVAQYDAELRGMDRALDGLLNRIESLGLYENSLIVITSDHGEEFLEHGELGHGNSLYEPQIRTPLLIKTPASYDFSTVAPGRHFQQVDILPTAAEVLGFPAPAGVQGAPWGAGRDHGLAELYCSACIASATNNPEKDRQKQGSAFERGDIKLIHSVNGGTRAYDLQADPRETSSLEALPEGFAQRAAEVIDGRRFIKATDGGSEQRPELMKNLRSLGYIQ